MVEVKNRITGIVRAEEEEDDEDEHMVREWEEGLPSLADLISLSQCLISPQLASAFSITSPSPSPSPSLSSAEAVGALASHAALSSLRGPLHTYSDLSPSSPTPQLTSHPLLPAADGYGAPFDNPRTELLSFGAIHRCYDEPNATNSGGVSLRPYDANSSPADDGQYRRHRRDDSQGNFASRDAELRSYGAVSVQEYQGGFQPAGAEGDGDCGERNAEHDGEACARANAWRPCASDGTNAAPRVDVDGEAEEADSTPSPSENVNEEVSARTLKRPRLVWTQELRKRFVDAVTHLGVRSAVPKTIMQLMNVEGLTRENVASHLQKYRQYLKRMQQGIAGEGPMASDHLFTSTPLPVNLPTSGRLQPGVPAHLQDVNQVPFLPSANPVFVNRGPIAGVLLPGPVPPMDPYTYNVYARPAHRLPHGDMLDVRRWRQHYCDPNQHVPKK